MFTLNSLTTFHISYCLRFVTLSMLFTLHISATGPEIPIVSTRIRTFNTTYETTTVEWVVPYITYDPEYYIVEYGTDVTDLSSSSVVVFGVTNYLATNQSYITPLSSLLHNTTYYYRVRSVNSITSVASGIQSFVTVPLRKYL